MFVEQMKVGGKTSCSCATIACTRLKRPFPRTTNRYFNRFSQGCVNFDANHDQLRVMASSFSYHPRSATTLNKQEFVSKSKRNWRKQCTWNSRSRSSVFAERATNCSHLATTGFISNRDATRRMSDTFTTENKHMRA